MRVTLVPPPPVPEMPTVRIEMTAVEAQRLRAILGGMADCSHEGISTKLYNSLAYVPGEKLTVEWGIDTGCSRSIEGFGPRGW